MLTLLKDFRAKQINELFQAPTPNLRLYSLDLFSAVLEFDIELEM